MKRNKLKASRSGVSPYKKYEKRPFRYSDTYQAWRSKFRRAEEARHAR